MANTNEQQQVAIFRALGTLQRTVTDGFADVHRRFDVLGARIDRDFNDLHFRLDNVDSRLLHLQSKYPPTELMPGEDQEEPENLVLHIKPDPVPDTAAGLAVETQPDAGSSSHDLSTATTRNMVDEDCAVEQVASSGGESPDAYSAVYMQQYLAQRVKMERQEGCIESGAFDDISWPTENFGASFDFSDPEFKKRKTTVIRPKGNIMPKFGPAHKEENYAFIQAGPDMLHEFFSAEAAQSFQYNTSAKFIQSRIKRTYAEMVKPRVYKNASEMFITLLRVVVPELSTTKEFYKREFDQYYHRVNWSKDCLALVLSFVAFEYPIEWASFNARNSLKTAAKPLEYARQGHFR